MGPLPFLWLINGVTNYEVGSWLSWRHKWHEPKKPEATLRHFGHFLFPAGSTYMNSKWGTVVLRNHFKRVCHCRKKQPGAFWIDQLSTKKCRLPPNFFHPVNPPGSANRRCASWWWDWMCLGPVRKVGSVPTWTKSCVVFFPHHALRLSVFCEKTRRFFKPSSSSAEKNLGGVFFTVNL